MSLEISDAVLLDVEVGAVLRSLGFAGGGAVVEEVTAVGSGLMMLVSTTTEEEGVVLRGVEGEGLLCRTSTREVGTDITLIC